MRELDASAAVLGREVPVIAERKVAYTATDGRKSAQDTNNSGADFVVSTSVDGTPLSRSRGNTTSLY